MPKVTTQKTRKERKCPSCGNIIHPGEQYRKWSFFRGTPKVRCMRKECDPKNSELTNNSYLKGIYQLQEQSYTYESLENAEAGLEELKSELETIKDESEEKFENLPEAFQYADQGQEFERQIEALEKAIEVVESFDFEDIKSEIEEAFTDEETVLEEIEIEITEALNELE